MDNGHIVAKIFKKTTYIKSLYNCGADSWKCRDYVGIPDGFAEIMLQNGNIVIYPVEIKTRVVLKTIEKAINTVLNYSDKVLYNYGNTILCECVPSENIL